MSEDSEATIRQFLGSYDLGRKLRSLRLRKKIALVDLGRHTGLSASMLSQLETGRLTPTLPTLARIAMVFDVGLEHFFDDHQRRKPFAIVRAAERLRFPSHPDHPQPTYFFECLAYRTQDKSMHAYLAEFPAESSSECAEHCHEGSEFLYVLKGSLTVRYQEECHTLEAGDSAYFDSSEPHSYKGSEEAASTQAIVVTSLPRS